MSAYRAFNMFGRTMAACAIYARHVRGLKLRNVQATTLKPDARAATVFADAGEATAADAPAKPSASK